jgi:hypothetical protein
MFAEPHNAIATFTAPELPATRSTDALQFRLNRLDAQIRVEYDTIGQRMVWLMISQSFLFSSFVTSTIAWETAESFHASVFQDLRWILAGIGLFSALMVWASILAAHDAIAWLLSIRDRVEENAAATEGIDRLGHLIPPFSTLMGNMPPKLIPLMLTATWGYLLWHL